MTENEIAKLVLDAAFAVHPSSVPVCWNRCMRSYRLTN